MKSQSSFGSSYLPRPLLLIVAAIVPVAAACNYLSHVRDVHVAPEAMSEGAVAARLAPVAHVLSATGDTKIASAYPVLPASN